jgi:NAD(P)-dependent dehydrogenase (short-subunit alcohol dehydrogenase family)
VIVSGRDGSRGEAVAAEIRSAGGKAGFVAADLALDANAVRDFAARSIAAAGGQVDILVNNAGVYPATATPDLPDPECLPSIPGPRTCWWRNWPRRWRAAEAG